MPAPRNAAARRSREAAASRPWFADMSHAQTPAEAARRPVDLALAGASDPSFSGELVQLGKVLRCGDEDVGKG